MLKGYVKILLVMLCSLGFDGVIRQAIHQLKYRNLRALAVPLAKLLNDYLATNPVAGEVLVAAPLPRQRLRERGYNQSSPLAKEIGKLIKLPVIDDYLIRKCFAPPQTKTTTVYKRRSNVVDTVTCHDHRLKDKQVLPIDDVSTSGSTMAACAAALKAASTTSV